MNQFLILQNISTFVTNFVKITYLIQFSEMYYSSFILFLKQIGTNFEILEMLETISLQFFSSYQTCRLKWHKKQINYFCTEYMKTLLAI